MAIKADTANSEKINNAIQQASEWGIDILVNSAGLFVTGEIDNEHNDLSALKRQREVDVQGVVNTVKNVLPFMKNGVSRSPYTGIGDYAATKAALAANRAIGQI